MPRTVGSNARRTPGKGLPKWLKKRRRGLGTTCLKEKKLGGYCWKVKIACVIQNEVGREGANFGEEKEVKSLERR